MYPSIESKITTGDFLVTEKIDGSNIAIGYINDSLRVQSRRQILIEPYDFLGLKKIIKPLIEIIEKIKSTMKCNFLVYGEIFGHMSSIKYYDSESEKIFKSNVVFFRAFDLFNVDRRVFLKYTDAIKIFEETKLPYVPILEINYKSVDDLYNKVEIEKSAYSDDILEGFVLKADEENKPNISRKIFKVKREKFDCKQLPSKLKIDNYITDQRFYSAFSKIGKDKEKIKKEIIKDILKDIMTHFTKNISEKVETFVEKNYTKFTEEM